MSVVGTGTSGAGGSKKSALSVAARLREQVAYDATIASDPKYKKYSQQVEKCLATFENMHEWPDLIAFLKQLLKTLQSYTQFKEIPRKLVVSKRLAQCLIPALPSGVHQRALDVYTHILSVLGPEGLKRELALWSSGLFPFFEYASTSVKPTLLNLFELYFLPLQESLRPVMRSFILALLPGLEEETGEYFEKTMGLLDRLSGTVLPSFFFQNIWLVMLTTQVPRAYALNYLSRRLPRLDAGEDITPIVGRDVGLMIRAFAAALADDNLLVQRAALDLLLQTMRLESAAVSRSSSADRTILMRAATGVVLRRDLSLNRRLFTWLLGKDENSDAQVAYFKKYGLDLLVETLRDEMMHPSCLYTHARPFKIFISLLDKWEIGSPLTEAIIYDALKAIKQSVQSSSEKGEDTLVTANTLYEAVEPRAIWKTLFTSVCKEIIEGKDKEHFDAIEMFSFVLDTFRLDEEEVQKLHLPLVFAALVELLKNDAMPSPAAITRQMYVSATDLLEKLSRCVPAEMLPLKLEFSDLQLAHGYYEAASNFYALPSNSENPETSDSAGPSDAKEIFADTFTNLCCISRFCAESLIADSGSDRNLWRVLRTVTSMIGNMLGLMASLQDLPKLGLELELDQWLDKIAETLALPGCTFIIVDNVVSIAASLHSANFISSTPSLSNRPRLLRLINALCQYLKPASSPYHVRAVHLIWSLEMATANGRVEAMLAHMLSHNVSYDEGNAFEMFGVLWRLSDDSQEPGFHFEVPMLIVLDTLRSEDPVIRQTGETWMRSNLRAYPRVLDPILVELTAKNIYRSEEYVTVKGREIPGLVYERIFDQKRISYLLEILHHVIRFGGQSFSRILSGVPISRSFHANLAEGLVQDGLGHEGSSYLEIIVAILIRFLKSEPKQSLSLPMRKLNVITQSHAIEVLQTLVSRGELEETTIDTLEAVVIGKLFVLVHTGQLELQNRLLHLLHSVVSASDALNERRKLRNSIAKPQSTSSTQLEQITDVDGINVTIMRPINPLLLQLLLDGVSTPSNRPLLHHWLDFVLLTIPQFPHLLASAVAPMNTCICRQLRLAIVELDNFASTRNHLESDQSSRVDDAQMNMLLNTLERLILLCLDEAEPSSPDDGGLNPPEKAATDNTLLSIMSNVFLPDSQTQHVHDSHMTAKSPGYRSLHEGVGVLYSIWSLVSEGPDESNPAYETLQHIYTRTLARCRRVLERFFRAHAFEVIESMVDYWNKVQDSNDKSETAFEIVDFLTASSQNVVHMVCESVSCRVNTSHERGRKQVLNPELNDGILFAFLEGYLSKLENPLAVQVWSRYIALAKDIATNVKEFRLQAYPALRCLSVLAHKISQTAVFDDRRVRKELQECYSKLLDAVVVNHGRGSEQGAWIRLVNRDGLLNGKETPISRVASEAKLDEKFKASADSTAELTQQASSADTSDHICRFLAQEALPNLRRFLAESDKITTACSNIIYYIVSPSLRNKAGRISELEDPIVSIIEQMSRITVAFKYWRTPATDVFNDSKFFASTAEAGLKWRTVITSMIDTDKSALTELIGKITAAQSANIFTNREYENQLRAMNIRRLSYILYAAEKNHYLTQLPAIQEKLVELFRGNVPANVESEIYLCIRVLLCRLSPHNLSSFWPVLLAELIQSFEKVIAEPPSDGSDSLQVLLAMCKLLDLLLVLQTEEFQIHQWVFITDTVDAIDRPDDWFPAALMDQLAEIVSDLHISESKRASSSSLPDHPANRTMQEPLLKGIRQIDSIHDLSTFFSHVSILSYESVYASGGSVDWTAVEDSLVEDMFTGW